MLDDYQALPGSAAFHEILARAAEDPPRGARLIIVSRAPLPEAYGHLKAKRRIAHLGWAALRLTPEEVRGVMRAQGRGPEGPDRAIRVHTLGRFTLVKDGAALVFDGKKAPTQPLTLLKALIALGGREVRVETLAHVLWPETAGDAAAQNVATNLFRLRRLLGDDAVGRQDGRLTLDPERCWVDAWAFERAVTDGEAGPVSVPDRGLALYKGCFLRGDLDCGWAQPLRNRLRSKWCRLLGREAQRYIEAGDPEGAVAVYERALETDDLAEEVHRALIQCHIALGRTGEALDTFRRCERVLCATLGLAPSEATRRLVKPFMVEKPR